MAYDAQGRPLYAHPPTTPTTPTPPPSVTPGSPLSSPETPGYAPNGHAAASVQAPAPQPAAPPQPTVVHVARAMEPIKQELPPEVLRRHTDSLNMYPFLNLSEGEFVVRAVRRHPIGLFGPMALGTVLLAFGAFLLVGWEAIAETMELPPAIASFSTILLPVLMYMLLVGLGMFVAWYVYVNNKFFLTNESVIQEIQTGLFHRNEQTVSLANIEDASFTQVGVLQHIFDYGSIRLSTEGDETTYRFSYVAAPKEHIAVLNNAVEAFKNGRPVGMDE